MGLQRESAISPLREAGAATPVVVPGAKARAVSACAEGYGRQGCKGRGSPCAMGPGRAKSPWPGCNAGTVAPGGQARCRRRPDASPAR